MSTTTTTPISTTTPAPETNEQLVILSPGWIAAICMIFLTVILLTCCVWFECYICVGTEKKKGQTQQDKCDTAAPPEKQPLIVDDAFWDDPTRVRKLVDDAYGTENY